MNLCDQIRRRATSESDIPPVPGGDDGGTNDFWNGVTNNSAPPTTNDLWLEIKSVSLTNSAASLVIHPPWNVSNGVYELLYCTSLAPPISWQWVLRTAPGQTNLTVFNASDPQGFYRLEVPTDSTGTNFWVAFFSVANNFGLDLSLYISSALGATGTVTVPGLGITNAFSVAAGAVTKVELDTSVMMTEFDYDVVRTKGIQVTASRPVSVYGVAYSFYLASSFTGYPTTLLGTNYCIISRPSLDDADGYAHSQFGIVATTDDTTVWITPSQTANLEGRPGFYQTNLMQGETYQINSSDITGDVTGTWVRSDKPVAVFAGAGAANVPDANTISGNPLVQEQLPVESWGQQALGLSFAGRTNGASYRVLAAYDDTVITIAANVVTRVDETSHPWMVTISNQVVVVTTNAGQCYDIIVDGPVVFQANHPIQVAQFANGCTSDHPYQDEGDPCEVLLPPTGHYLQTNIVFSLPYDPDYVTGDFDENYLNIIVPQSALTNTLVDGLTVAATNFIPIGTSGYYGAQLPVTNDVSGATCHTVISSQPVGVQAYGFGYTDAYGYFGGVVR